MSRRYVIAGTGAAGIAAAESIRSQDASGDILLVSDDPHGYYSRPGLAYYLTGEVPENALFPFRQEDFERLRLRRLQARVTAIDPAAHRVELDRGESVAYDRLLLATGSLALPASVAGAGLKGVVKLDDMADARCILQACSRARAAVVVGGGITALELAEGLRARRVQTHYFIRRERYWSNVLDETESRIVERRLQKEGVHLHYHTELAQIQSGQGRRRREVAGVVTGDGKLIPCGLVAVAIGVQPRAELARAAGLAVDRGVLVSETLCSSDPDVFAAGDVAQVLDPRSGRAVLDTLWGVAVAEGRVAGLNVAGQRAVYSRSVPFNVTRLAGITTTIIGAVGQGRDADVLGIVRGDSETWRHLPSAVTAQHEFEVNRLRVLVGERALLGAVVMGDQSLSQPLYGLIAGQADISPIRDRLVRGIEPVAGVLAEFWADWYQHPSCDFGAPML